MEPARPIVDQMVLEFIRRYPFEEDSCYETREGFCRLDTDLITAVTPWMARLRSEVVSIVRRVLESMQNQAFVEG